MDLLTLRFLARVWHLSKSPVSLMPLEFKKIKKSPDDPIGYPIFVAQSFSTTKMEIFAKNWTSFTI